MSWGWNGGCFLALETGVDGLGGVSDIMVGSESDFRSWSALVDKSGGVSTIPLTVVLELDSFDSFNLVMPFS